MASRVAVRIRSQRRTKEPTKFATPKGRVWMELPEPKISKGSRKSFHIHMLFRIITVMVMGFSSGNTILKKTAGLEQPSIIAASSSSYGTPFIKPWYKKMDKDEPKPM